jgi:hypothetical protein
MCEACPNPTARLSPSARVLESAGAVSDRSVTMLLIAIRMHHPIQSGSADRPIGRHRQGEGVPGMGTGLEVKVLRGARW